MTDIYNCTPRQTYSHMLDIVEAGLVPNVLSSPGMGKSSLYKKLCKHFGLKLIDHRLSTSQPEDLTGLPEFITNAQGQRIATFTPFDIFPLESTPIPDGYEGWFVFFDEFNSGTKETQAASYKILLDRYVGQLPLHERVAMGLAGNLMTDRAFTNDLSTALQSRVIHIHMILSFKEWLQDVALAEDYDERIIAWVSYDEDALFDFRPDHQDKTFNCPRTIEFLNRLVKGKEVNRNKTSLYAGTISSGHAANFVEFCDVYKELMTIEDVLRDPMNAHIPDRSERTQQWALVTHLMKRIDDKNFGDLCKYINRFNDLSFQVLFFRGALANHPTLRRHPGYIDAMQRLQTYLAEDTPA